MERGDRLVTAQTSRIIAACVLLATALSGLLFAPIFGLWPLAAPIAVVVVACYAAFELCQRFPSLRSWRPVLALVAGLMGLTEVTLCRTTLAGLPTSATVRGLVSGVTESWQLTLQSTWPVRPAPELLLFVPLAVLAAAVLSIELLRWPAVALLPSLGILGLTQVFTPWSGPAATVVALGYTALSGGVFLASRPGGDSARRRAVLVIPAVVLAVVAAVVVTGVDQGRQPAYSLHQNHPAPAPAAPAINPLDEVAARLKQPDAPVFSYTSADPVDRWRLVVLDDFDGVTWSTGDRYQRLGADLAPSAAVPTTPHSAQVTIPAGDEPWLPSQAMPASVTGADPLVDPASGMLLDPDRAGVLNYELTWREPQVDPAALASAALDQSAVRPDALGVIPPGISELARTATAGMRPSFQTALVLERYLSQNYHVAVGADLPTGHAWPQLSQFLLSTKRGTSEQFAAAYVALAKIAGIPARIAVGFHPPQATGQVVVRGGDVLAWPEVAVAGIGWVPLDPTGTASDSGAGAPGLARITAQARADLPAPQDIKDPPLPAGADDQSGPGTGIRIPVLPIVFALLALIVLTGLAIPLLKTIRTWRRRRRAGAHGVAAAAAEARDLLREHGLPLTRGMTVRDFAGAVSEQSVVDSLMSLARLVDLALWSGIDVGDDTVREAWAAVRAVRRGLGRRSLFARVRAVFDPRSLSIVDSKAAYALSGG
ncbi:transglutaminaseTgpA domain-containing protein [Amycolatopsis sp. GM8]|uniref:transglutaminase TgpA family protein n=1 Tax=Amycolatopsis sp. GM8 TaxID=2896530 RepID=UPI001F4646F4|nr:transglutaminaseTgpA domain-containing protein [Amycolatopsis sp. GM8]